MLIRSTVLRLMLVVLAFSTVSIGLTAPIDRSNNKQKIEFPLLTLTVCESHGRKFEIEMSGETANIKAGEKEDFGGTILCFDRENLEYLDVFVRFNFGAVQHLFEGDPAKPLDVDLDSGWTAIEVDDQAILIPQSNDNYPGVLTVYEHLGLAGRDEFEMEFERVNVANLISQSMRMQRDAYLPVLKPEERSRMQKCCPERLAQAERFNNKAPAEFSTLRGLSIEPYRKKTVIEIKGETQDGEQFVYRIVDENKLQR